MPEPRYMVGGNEIESFLQEPRQLWDVSVRFFHLRPVSVKIFVIRNETERKGSEKSYFFCME